MGTPHAVAREKRELVLKLREDGVSDDEIARRLGYASVPVIRVLAWRAREERKRAARRLRTVAFATTNANI